MTFVRFAATACLALSCIGVTPAVHAEDWQTYSVTTITIHEIDADSIRVSDGLVHFRYRQYLASGTKGPAIFERAIDAVADCAGRRHADLTRAPLELMSVHEATLSARQLDFACRLAGQASKPPTPTVHKSEPDWEEYERGTAIDRNSIRVEGPLVFFAYARVGGRITAESDTAVIDCAGRQRSEVAGKYYTLQKIVEGGYQVRQAELACRLAKMPMPAGASPAPVDFSVRPSPKGGVEEFPHYNMVRNLVKTQDGLIHFQYASPYMSDGSTPQEHHFFDAVVDCATRRRSDEVAGKFDLQPVDPSTRGASQVNRVCKYAEAKVAAETEAASAAR
jgi:hypothetical protein